MVRMQARSAWLWARRAPLVAVLLGLTACGSLPWDKPEADADAAETPSALADPDSHRVLDSAPAGAPRNTEDNASASDVSASKTALAVPASAPRPNAASAATPSAPLVMGALPAAPPGDDDYRIGPQDLLEIEVFQVEDLSRIVRVNARGNISLPLVGTIPAAGRTAEELELAIQEKLAVEYLQDPQVSIFIKEYTSQRVTLEGWVKRPGVYPIQGRTTLLQAIAMGEGLDELGNPDKVYLFRVDPKGQTQGYVADLAEIREGKLPDPLVRGDDRIVVHRAGSKAFVKGVTDTLRGFLSFGRL